MLSLFSGFSLKSKKSAADIKHSKNIFRTLSKKGCLHRTPAKIITVREKVFVTVVFIYEKKTKVCHSYRKMGVSFKTFNTYNYIISTYITHKHTQKKIKIKDHHSSLLCFFNLCVLGFT